MYDYITHEGNLNLLYCHVHQALFLPTPLVCLTFWCDLLALCFQVCFSIIFPQHISLPFLLFDKIDILSSHIYLCLVVVVIVYILISPSHSKPPHPLPSILSLSLSLSLWPGLPLLHIFLCSSARRNRMADFNRNDDFYASQDFEAASMTKKYGGLVPKKKPLISKDHERAFFDSADWALCKQGAGVNQNSKVAIETLQPKLQRTPHQRLPPRRPACTSGNHGEPV